METTTYEYTEKVIKVIKNAGRWLVYYKKTPYLIDPVASVNNLEKLVKEVMLNGTIPK